MEYFESEMLEIEKMRGDNELYTTIIELGKINDHDSVYKLEHIFTIRFSYEFDKKIIPYLTCLSLINKGKLGIKIIKDSLVKASRVTYSNVMFHSLLSISNGRLPRRVIDRFEDFEKSIIIDNSIVMEARKSLLDFVTESKNDYEKFEIISDFFYIENKYILFGGENQDELIKNFYNLISQTSISISSGMIYEFRELVEKELKEEEYQIFFKEHPVFLNPLAKEIVDKKRLGDDYITDFIIHLVNEEYILVEIEKPQDNIFTSNDEFTSKFTHAFGQVLDFINWIDMNISYAQTKMPGIKSPKGILIMGLRAKMTEKQKMKLKKYNENSHSIEILTFDDLIYNAERLLDNILS